jgi:hypothetical protein
VDDEQMVGCRQPMRTMRKRYHVSAVSVITCAHARRATREGEVGSARNGEVGAQGRVKWVRPGRTGVASVGARGAQGRVRWVHYMRRRAVTRARSLPSPHGKWVMP